MLTNWQFSTTGVLTCVVVLILALITLYRASERDRLSLPPGPRGWPLIGNLLDIPQSDIVKTQAQWARKYGAWLRIYNHCLGVIDLKQIPGKVVYVDAAGQPMIILNDVDLANELLDKKGVTCSNRPVLNMAGELAGFKEFTVFQMYGQRLKESRKHIHRAIGNRESLKMFDSLFETEIRNFLKANLRDPDDIQKHIRRYES